MTGFIISSMSDFERPIDRVRQDRGWREFEKSAPPFIWREVWAYTKEMLRLAGIVALVGGLWMVISWAH